MSSGDSYIMIDDQSASNPGNTSLLTSTFTDVPTRYVKVTITGCAGSNCSSSDWISINEVKIYGCVGAEVGPATLSRSSLNVYSVPCSVCNTEIGKEWLGAEIQITDLLGKVIYSGQINDYNQSLYLSRVYKGFAILEAEKKW